MARKLPDQLAAIESSQLVSALNCSLCIFPLDTRVFPCHSVSLLLRKWLPRAGNMLNLARDDGARWLIKCTTQWNENQRILSAHKHTHIQTHIHGIRDTPCQVKLFNMHMQHPPTAHRPSPIARIFHLQPIHSSIHPFHLDIKKHYHTVEKPMGFCLSRHLWVSYIYMIPKVLFCNIICDWCQWYPIHNLQLSLH